MKTTAPKRVVIKLGTGVLTSGIGQLNTERIAALASGVAGLLAFVLMYFNPEADYTGSEHDDAEGAPGNDVTGPAARHTAEHA